MARADARVNVSYADSVNLRVTMICSLPALPLSSFAVADSNSALHLGKRHVLAAQVDFDLATETI